MKIIKQIILPLLLVAVFSSCSLLSFKTATVDADYIAKHGFMMAKPQLVEIAVEKRKIEGSAVVKNKLYGGPAATDAAKNLAVMDAIKKGGADIIVQPFFEIESNGKFTTVVVRGFAGKYKEFRDIKHSDTTAFWLRRRSDSYASTIGTPGEISYIKGKGK